jgi:imidazolonepropionase-like amidohydrolase
MKIDRADAIRWVTMNPARALGIDKVTGSLEPGKNADVVLWSGDPFSAYAKAEQVFVDGALLYNRAEAAKQHMRDFMTGQPGAAPTGPGPITSRPGQSAASAQANTPDPGAQKPNSLGVSKPQSGLGSGPTGAGPLVAIINGTVRTAVGPAIERGTVLIRDGRITAVGANVTVPQGAKVIDAAGKIVTPGFIESNTNLGIVEISLSAEGTADQNSTDPGLGAAFNVVDAFNPFATAIPVTRVDGITRALVVPGGTRHLLLGQAAVFDLLGEQVPASVTRSPAAMMAVLGEAGAGLAGGSRASAMLRLRELLQDAVDFNRNRPAWNNGQRRDYARGRLDLEALRPVVLGELPLAVSANRASDLLAALRLADEFKLKLILVGAAEGWKVADQLARARVPVIIKPLTNIPSFDALGATLENAARLHRAGVTVALSSFETHRAHTLRQEAGNAVSNGLDADAALRAVTLTPAQIWGIASTTGSLEVGKDADVVVWSGDPFELTTSAERVFIKGHEVPKETRQTELLKKHRTIDR